MIVPPFLHPFTATGRTDFITLVSGHGSTVVDDTGKEYLDGIASLWCVNVGHGRSEVIDAVADQMRALATYNTFDRWTNQPADDLARLIADRAPMPESRVFFTNSGSEAVDTAMKLARLTQVIGGDPGRSVIVARGGGYHGTTYGGTSAQGMEPNRTGFGPLVGEVVHASRHDLEEMAAIFEQRGASIAAVITEPVQGASGVHTPRAGYLEGLRRLCDDHGALLVFDEVITGFGRLGTWFAAEHYGVEPDLVTFAKAVTSGYIPLGGVIVGPVVRQALEKDPEMVLRTGFTYSGHPTAAAAAMACIAVTDEHRLLERARALGLLFGDRLGGLLSDGLVTEVRGEGAIWAVDIAEAAPGDAPAIATAMIDDGVIVRPIGPTTLALCPPLVLTDDEACRIVESMRRALAG